MKTKKLLYHIFSLLIMTSLSCKKKEERVLIRNYEGQYIGTKTTNWCCDDNGFLIVETENVEVEIKKSVKGIKTTGIQYFDNFDVNISDSTFHARSKNNQEWANGKFHPNDSIWLSVRLSPKLPNGYIYRLKRK